MNRMILGIFSSRSSAEMAIAELQDAGYQAKDISVITNDRVTSQQLVRDTGATIAEGAVSGAATGGVIGAITGLLIGVGAIAIPGIGGLLIAGPLAAVLGLTGASASTVVGAATGALAGGLIGALMGLGVPEETARVYEDRIKAGGILVAIPAREGSITEARLILEDNDAEQIESVGAESNREPTQKERAPSYFSRVVPTRKRKIFSANEDLDDL